MRERESVLSKVAMRGSANRAFAGTITITTIVT